MATHFESVKEFYTGFKQDEFISETPSLDESNITKERLFLKLELISEEYIELIEAVLGKAAGKILKAAWELAKEFDDETRDVVELADALADLDYVLNGLAIEAGIPHDEVFEEVHSSNMSKLDDEGNPIMSDGVTPSEYDGQVKPVGKILKSKNFREPNIAGLLESKTR